MGIFSEINKPRLFESEGFNAILDCGHMSNRWLEIALGYLPNDLPKNTKEQLLFTSTAARDACRVARYYCETREIILVSERILPGKVKLLTDPKARYFIYVILHEVAHAIKRHKSPLFDDLSDEEFKIQEKEADDLAIKWFNDHLRDIENMPPITKEEIKTIQATQQELMRKLIDGI